MSSAVSDFWPSRFVSCSPTVHRPIVENSTIEFIQNGTAHIAVGRTSWELLLQDGSEYPPLPDISEIEMFNIDRAKFLGAISTVRHAAAKDTVRPSLMLIDINKGQVRAADGVRFQQALLGKDFPLDIQIPIKAVEDLVKLLRSTDQTSLEVGESENHLAFRVAADVFIANKLVYQFPDVDEMLLKPALGNRYELNVDRQELISAIRRVKITADAETSAMTLGMTKNSLTVKSRDKFGNGARESLDARWEQEDREATVNFSHLLDMLLAVDVKSCHFFLGDDTKTRKSPLLLRDDEAGSIGVLTQIRAELLQ